MHPNQAPLDLMEVIALNLGQVPGGIELKLGGLGLSLKKPLEIARLSGNMTHQCFQATQLHWLGPGGLLRPALKA